MNRIPKPVAVLGRRVVPRFMRLPVNDRVNPHSLAKRTEEALDASKASGRCITLRDMSEERIRELEAKYGCPIKRPQ